MVRLYLLGFTHDLKGVVFSRRRNGRTAAFWVPIDEKLLAALPKLERARRDRERTGRERGGRKGDVLDLNDLPAAAKSRALPPVGRSQARTGMPASEIQKMLREGRTVKNVAATAKTPIAWVERLAEPVVTERMGVVRLAQRAYMQRPRLGASGMQLGDAVRINLEARGANTDPFEGIEAAWDARARPSGTWRVWFRFNHRGKRRVAEWEFKKGSRTILPRNRLAGQLGWAAPDAELSEPAEPGDGEVGEGADQQAQGSRPAKPRSRGRTSRSARTKRSRPTSRSAKRAPARKKVTKPRRGRPSQRRRR